MLSSALDTGDAVVKKLDNVPLFKEVLFILYSMEKNEKGSRVREGVSFG